LTIVAVVFGPTVPMTPFDKSNQVLPKKSTGHMRSPPRPGPVLPAFIPMVYLYLAPTVRLCRIASKMPYTVVPTCVSVCYSSRSQL
jgi:hypothetical protein